MKLRFEKGVGIIKDGSFKRDIDHFYHSRTIFVLTCFRTANKTALFT